MKITVSALSLLVVMGLFCGCGTNNNKCVYGNNFAIGSPSSTNVANHASKSPANQIQFMATSSPSVVSGSGCALPTTIAIVDATWTTSEPNNVTISSAPDNTNGLATCVNATNGPVTVTATAPTGSVVYTPNTATTTLTCK